MPGESQGLCKSVGRCGTMWQKNCGLAPCELDLEPAWGAKAANSAFKLKDGRICQVPQYSGVNTASQCLKLQFCLLEAQQTSGFAVKICFKMPGVRSKHVIWKWWVGLLSTLALDLACNLASDALSSAGPEPRSCVFMTPRSQFRPPGSDIQDDGGDITVRHTAEDARIKTGTRKRTMYTPAALTGLACSSQWMVMVHVGKSSCIKSLRFRHSRQFYRLT